MTAIVQRGLSVTITTNVSMEMNMIEKSYVHDVDCNYITYDKDTGSTYLGACFFNCENSNKTKYETVYIQLPKNPEMLLNKSVCNYFHGTGLLCGDCEDGRSPLVLSHSLSCVLCPDGYKTGGSLS